jgi:hypothetical protein
LTDVLYRLADTSVAGADKVALVENATSADTDPLANFAQALAAAGFNPVNFQAADLAWSPTDYGAVTADVTVTASDKRAGHFGYPMEFKPVPSGGWQLAHKTAELLLQLRATLPSAAS